MSAPAELVDRARRFLLRDLWHMELERGSIATAPIRLLQFGYVVVEGFVRDELLLRASALTYMASLALIPALVVVLAVLKGRPKERCSRRACCRVSERFALCAPSMTPSA